MSARTARIRLAYSKRKYQKASQPPPVKHQRCSVRGDYGRAIMKVIQATCVTGTVLLLFNSVAICGEKNNDDINPYFSKRLTIPHQPGEPFRIGSDIAGGIGDSKLQIPDKK